MMNQKSFSFVIVIFFGIILFMTSCKGQETTEPKPAKELGELVSTIDDNIWRIFQDSKGNYWFGSNGNGVLRFDGKNLRRYSVKDGVAHGQVGDIQEDHLGFVYIGTPNGISKFDGSSFSTLKLNPTTLNEWRLNATDLWFNTVQNEIYRYDGEQLFALELPKKDLNKAFGTEVRGLGFKGMNSSPYAVYGLNKDKQGNLWIGTIVAGAYRYDGDSFLWVAEKELSTLPDGRVPGVRSLLEDKNGFMWLSNFKSKYKINEASTGTTYEKLPGVLTLEEHFKSLIPFFNSGLADANGDLWVTTYTGGVWKYDGKELVNYKLVYGETEVLLVSIYQDNDGILWVGTDNAGVFKFNGKTFDKFVLEIDN